MDGDIRILEVEPGFIDLKFRTPLKFGKGVVTDITSYTVRIKVENKKGETADGFGNVLLSYLWAYPSKKHTAEERDAAMREIALKLACEVAPLGKVIRVAAVT